jgi:hypothetical protein
MSAARYTNRVRTQSQARVTKAQYPGSISNNYDPLFSSIDCNVSYNVLDYKGVPCICKPVSQPFPLRMRLGQINRTAAVQFSVPVSVDEPVISTFGEIDMDISVRMALPEVSNDPVPIPTYEGIRNVYVPLSVENNEVENVPQRSYGAINTNIRVIGYAQMNETPEPVVLPTFEGIRNVRVMTQAPVPNTTTDMFPYPSYEKLHNIKFNINIPKFLQSDPIPIVEDIGILPKFEGLRSVGVPLSVPQLTNEPVPMPNYEKRRNVSVTVSLPELDDDRLIRNYQHHTGYHITEITSSEIIGRLARLQNYSVPLVPETFPVLNYDINPAVTNPRFQLQDIRVQTPKEIVFGGGSENPDDYVVYGGGNSQLLL